MMTKKFSLTFCAAALIAAGAFAATVHAQKRTEPPADARQTRHDEKPHDTKAHDEKAHDMGAHADCPLMGDSKAGAKAEGGGHGSHLAEVSARGERAMGFSQTETTHHFRLTRD